jgi:hypothetical protein
MLDVTVAGNFHVIFRGISHDGNLVKADLPSQQKEREDPLALAATSSYHNIVVWLPVSIKGVSLATILASANSSRNAPKIC